MSKTSYGFYMGSTAISVDKTVGEIVSILRRIRATAIGFDYAGDTVKGIRFALTIPNAPAPVEFELPARVDPLFKRMQAKGMRDRAQAERVAWRQVLRWVEVQVAMIDCGMAAPGEVFLPYAITASGRTVYELFEETGARMLGQGKGEAA
jgi:hypothetical protein